MSEMGAGISAVVGDGADVEVGTSAGGAVRKGVGWGDPAHATTKVAIKSRVAVARPARARWMVTIPSLGTVE